MDIRIRAGNRKDREMIWKATMETVWADLPPDEAQGLDRASFEENFRGHARGVIESPRNATFVAEAPAGDAVGYIVVGGATSMLSPRTFGFVYDIWVAPGKRRRGIGRALLERAEAWCLAQGYGKLKLEVSARNAGGRGLYAAAGFVEERLYMGKTL